MKVLLSIKPEYAEKIFSGEKKFEYRKALFKNTSVKTVVVYATMPVGKVIGEFEIEHILSEDPQVLWKKTSTFSGISKTFFESYFHGKSMAHAIKVKKSKKYKKPISLSEILPHGVPPQSFCYI